MIGPFCLGFSVPGKKLLFVLFHQAMIRVARAEKIMAESQLQQGADAETLVKLGRKAFSWSEGIVDVFRKENPVNVNKIDCPVDTRIFNKKITI